MNINKQKIDRSFAIKLTAQDGDATVGRAYLYLIYNDLHEEPYGLLEDVFVEESHRGKGLGTDLINRVIAEAKEQGCYKLVGTSRESRPEVHKMYEGLGFDKYGFAFRLNLK
jgi:GNAT superfamily N-acetyltransferase